MSEKQELRIRVANLQAENADLRAKLEAANKRADNLAERVKKEVDLMLTEASRADKAEQERDTAQRMLDLANKALERAGSAARFGIKRDIPKGALVFRDTAETLEQNWDDEPAYSQKQWRELETDRDNLQAQLEALKTKIRKAFLDTNKIPPFLPGPRAKPLDEVIDRMAYRSDQLWTIVGIIANYPTLQKEAEDISDAVKRLVELLDMTKRDNDSLLNQLAYMRETMTQIQDIIKNYKEIHEIEIGNIVHQALSTTPEQAGEQVRGLVISEIESCDNCKWNDPGNEHCEMCSPFLSEWSSDHKLVREIIDAAFDIAMKYDDYSMPDYSEPDAVNNARKRLYNALAKYRGGAE